MVVVPAAKAAEVARRLAGARGQGGRDARRLAAGELGLDIYDMRDKLKAAGLVYYDVPDDVK